VTGESFKLRLTSLFSDHVLFVLYAADVTLIADMHSHADDSLTASADGATSAAKLLSVSKTSVVGACPADFWCPLKSARHEKQHVLPMKCVGLIALIAFDYRYVRSRGSEYINDVLDPSVHPVGTSTRLRSADRGDIVVPSICTLRFSSRGFRSPRRQWCLLFDDIPPEL